MGMSSVDGPSADLAASQLPQLRNSSVCSQTRETVDQEKQSGESKGGEIEPRNACFNTANSPLPQWNDPRINLWRTLTCFLGFFIMGANDAAFGVQPLHATLQ